MVKTVLKVQLKCFSVHSKRNEAGKKLKVCKEQQNKDISSYIKNNKNLKRWMTTEHPVIC